MQGPRQQGRPQKVGGRRRRLVRGGAGAAAAASAAQRPQEPRPAQHRRAVPQDAPRTRDNNVQDHRRRRRPHLPPAQPQAGRGGQGGRRGGGEAAPAPSSPTAASAAAVEGRQEEASASASEAEAAATLEIKIQVGKLQACPSAAKHVHFPSDKKSSVCPVVHRNFNLVGTLEFGIRAGMERVAEVEGVECPGRSDLQD